MPWINVLYSVSRLENPASSSLSSCPAVIRRKSMKSGRMNVGAYRAVHEDNPCVIPPGTADIGRVLRTTLRGKAAVVENIAVFLPFGGGSGGGISGS